MFRKYRNKEQDVAIFKNIPIQHLAEFQKTCRLIGLKLRCVFRGTRKGHHSGYCLKKDAKTFTVYPPLNPMRETGFAEYSIAHKTVALLFNLTHK